VESERKVVGEEEEVLEDRLRRVNNEVETESAKWMKYLGNREVLKHRE
jgi:hypothetical protein